ncbi:RBBP9/YdeN family alpha/beta hydrolase [Mycolicibacterium sp. CBM1]
MTADSGAQPIALPDMPMVFVPGIGDSGPDHWQSLWQLASGGARIAPASYAEPELGDWLQALTRAVEGMPSAPVVIAHSLGCLAAIAWAATPQAVGRVAGYFLVAVPDPHERGFPLAASTFRDVVAHRLVMPAMIVASANDPYGSLRYSRGVAARTGATLRTVGRRGHINAASGVGAWPVGQRLLAEFVGTIG